MADPDFNAWLSAYRQAITAKIDAHNTENNLVSEFNARGWSGNIDEADIIGTNAGITGTEISDAIGSTAAVETLMGQGHRTNFAKMYKRGIAV